MICSMCEHRTLKKKGLRRTQGMPIEKPGREHRTLKKKGLRPRGRCECAPQAREHRTLKKKGLRRCTIVPQYVEHW